MFNSFKDDLKKDLETIFNLNEFAETATIDGTKIPIILDITDTYEITDTGYNLPQNSKISFHTPKSAITLKGLKQKVMYKNVPYKIDNIDDVGLTYKITISKLQ